MAYAQTWDLDGLYPNPASADFQNLWDEFLNTIQSLSEKVDTLPKIEGAEAAAPWSDFLAQWAETRAMYWELNSFAGCHAAADAGNLEYRKLESRLAALEPLSEKIATSVEFALQPCTDEVFDAFVDGDERLTNIRFYLEEKRQKAALRLPREQELLAAEL